MSTKTDENAEPVEKIVCVDSDSEEECVDAEPVQPKITSLSEAIEMLDDLAEFAERRLQDESLVSSLNKVCSAMQNLRIRNFRQKRISDYFGTTPEFTPKLLNLRVISYDSISLYFYIYFTLFR